MNMKAVLIAAVAVWPATASAEELVGASDPVGIYGGTPVGACAWPTTVFVNDCTGTLVHPSVVVLAAHCIVKGGQVTEALFGEDYNQPVRTVAVASCTAHPDWQDVPPGDGAADIAICELAEPVDDVAIVPILMGCETDALQVGASVTLVGFGDSDDALGDGPKREVVTQIQQLGTDAAWIGGNGQSSCYGDSGGPAYIQLDDGSWRVFGATSGSATDDRGCGQTSIWTLVHVYASWIEGTAGVDVTPCHDADGTWNPSDGCVGFPMAPGAAGGAWTDGCAGEASGVVESCGAGFGGGSTGDTTTEGSDSGEASSAGVDETGGEDPSAETQSSGGASDDDASDATSSDAVDEDGPSGCGCASARHRSAPWALLLAAVARGRRRDRATNR